MKVEPKWVELGSVLLIHEWEQLYSGGLSGVRDQGMLESATNRARNRFLYDEDATVFDLAACYGFGIARNHPFLDGNKRSALLTSLGFLEKNGWEVNTPPADLYTTFMRLAAGDLTEDELAEWFKNNVKQMP